MQVVDTIVVGAGHTGLALSAELTGRGVDHVVLERGRIAERWRSERWDSMRLITPNWMTRLPGAPAATDPDGFMTAGELAGFLERYARSFGSPVREGVAVKSVRAVDEGFLVETDGCGYLASNVVVATGYCDVPVTPAVARDFPPGVVHVHSSDYRSPDALPEGAVLVVGAGASGIQIAAELRRAGRSVVLSTGSHARAVRRYRGKDLWWWMDRIGSLDVTVDEIPDVEAARRSPSFGLTGANGGEDIDLGIMRARGVRIAGRLESVTGTRVRFADDLAATTAEADLRLARLLDRFDESVAVDEDLPPAPLRPAPVRIGDPVETLDLREGGFSAVVWATGYRRTYPWLRVPVLDEHGEIVQRRGVTPVKGLYVLGMRFLWTRGSHFIDRAGQDASYVAAHIAARSVTRSDPVLATSA